LVAAVRRIEARLEERIGDNAQVSPHAEISPSLTGVGDAEGDSLSPRSTPYSLVTYPVSVSVEGTFPRARHGEVFSFTPKDDFMTELAQAAGVTMDKYNDDWYITSRTGSRPMAKTAGGMLLMYAHREPLQIRLVRKQRK
jgi:hypothetical protein